MVGEIHTGLLQNSIAVERELSTQLLGLVRGEGVRLSERPILYAVSPERLLGVDCLLPTDSGRRLRGVGTVVSRALITGGQVLQGSSFVTVNRGQMMQRQSWPHYLARPGVVEALGRVRWPELAAGFLVDGNPLDQLDVGTASAAIMDEVQRSPALDRQASIRSARTRLRWVAEYSDDHYAGVEQWGPKQFGIGRNGMRTLQLQAGPGVTVAQLAARCEDLALHEWLLTSLLAVIERSGIGQLDRGEVARRLMPALEHLVHLWMPAARVDTELWDAIDRVSGLGRQWQVSVDRVRALTVDVRPLLERAPRPEPPPKRKRVFISYVREDSEVVDRIAAELRREGIDVWLDRTHLLPGDRWAQVIQEAISDGDFFIACFSAAFASRKQTYMAEELLIAIDQLRKRPYSRRWFLPVLLGDCEVPKIPIGPGDTLRSLHAVDFSLDWHQAKDQLVRAVETSD